MSTTDTTPTTTSAPRWAEFVATVSGREIRDIEERYGVDWEALTGDDLDLRASTEIVAYINRRRDGLSAVDAYEQASDLTVTDLNEVIDWSPVERVEDGTEAEPFPPRTESGKGSEPSESPSEG